ncbi:hypothetical protein BGZ76_004323 [Entomortierella beljakovae]|nr:hypothetical protein BGZ76_004323 [Entomortierella beljakovae]
MSRVYLNWALEDKGKEHVFLTNFVTHFGLTQRESATKSFEDLLQSPRITRTRREFLNSEFIKFKTHYANDFWEKHSLKLSVSQTSSFCSERLKVNSKRTVLELASEAQDTVREIGKAAYVPRKSRFAHLLPLRPPPTDHNEVNDFDTPTSESSSANKRLRTNGQNPTKKDNQECCTCVL